MGLPAHREREWKVNTTSPLEGLLREGGWSGSRDVGEAEKGQEDVESSEYALGSPAHRECEWKVNTTSPLEGLLREGVE